MATGNMKWFAAGLLALGNKLIDLTNDTLKLGIVTTATVPSLSTADPRWGAGGTTNFSSSQVATGGTAYTGPVTLTSKTWSLVSNVPTLRAADITLAQDGSGFTNGAYGIIYDDTDAGKRALGFVELASGGTASLVAGAITIDWGGAGTDLLTITQS